MSSCCQYHTRSRNDWCATSEHFYHRNESTRRQIESNDPQLKKLWIGRLHYRPTDEDWERGGKAVGENTHIKELRLDYDNDASNVEAFCGGLAGNRSIERLKIEFFGGEIFNKLGPFHRLG
mgnify:CR=1 FL=1